MSADDQQTGYTYRLSKEQAVKVAKIANQLNVKTSEVCKWIFDEGFNNLPRIFETKSRAISIILGQLEPGKKGGK